MKFLLLSLIAFLGNTVFAQNISYTNVVKKFAKEKNFSGTVLVANKGKVVYNQSFGLANRQDKIMITNQSKYKIASITKTFTATIILQLMEEGKIDLNKTIGTYYPEYNGEARDKATIHHLLTYSSGIENVDQGSEAMYAMQLPIDSIITKYCSGKLVNEPGKQMSYKNADYIILGKIIEKITGNAYPKVLQERILKPLAMNNTGYLKNKDIVEGLVNYYLADSIGNFYNDDPYWIENFYASGSMYATAEDLLKFDQALFGNKLLKKQTVDLMTTAYPELWGVAYSFWVSNKEVSKIKTKVMDRRGSISGANTAWYHFLKENKTVIVFSNSNAADVTELRELLAEIVIKN
jgi:CubicO group peptidase (beta-lactamase class C family)